MDFLKKIFVVGACLCAVFCATLVNAEEVVSAEASPDSLAVGTLESDAFVKLGRGVTNVAFGPLELLIKPYDVNKNVGALPAITYGVFKGIGYTIAREVVGVIDIVTFFMPLPGAKDDPREPGWGYGPLMRPAWVIDLDHNAYNFFYPNNTLNN